MKILLINPSNPNQKFWEAKPPLGIGYLASSLEAHNHKVKISDMAGFNINSADVINTVYKFQPDLIGLSVVTPYLHVAEELSELIRSKFNMPIVIGGPHPSAKPSETLKNYENFDVAVIGEGEQTIIELANAIEKKSSLKNIKGISFKKNNKVYTNAPRHLIKNLDTVPFPAWHLFNVPQYYKDSKKRLEIRGSAFSIITSRGCPGRCTFCDSHNIWGHQYRTRSPKNIIEEITRLYFDYNIRYLFFWDDTFTANKKQVIETCKLIRNLNIDLRWECYGRVNLVDDELLKALKRAGCESIWYGIESGSQKVLNYIKKGITLEQAKRAVALTKKNKLKVGAFWMIGFPIESKKEIRDTINFCKSLKLDYYDDFSILTPFPGSELYKTMKFEGLLLHEDWSYFFNRRADKEFINIKTEYLSTEELHSIYRSANKEIIKYNLQRKILFYMFNPIALLRRVLHQPKFFYLILKKILHTGS